MKRKEAIRKLEEYGFVLVRSSNHLIFKKEEAATGNIITFPLPNHNHVKLPIERKLLKLIGQW